MEFVFPDPYVANTWYLSVSPTQICAPNIYTSLREIRESIKDLHVMLTIL